MAYITINGNSLDPVAQRAAFENVGLESIDTSASNYIPLQAAGPISKKQRAQLRSEGVTILEYVPDDSYIAYYPPKDLTPVEQLPLSRLGRGHIMNKLARLRATALLNDQ